MAGNIKGITIDIGGNVQPLTNALKDVNKAISNTQGEPSAVNKLLKFDPKNTTLLEQKQKLLETQIGNTAKKLDTLKEAQKQAGDALARGDAGAEEQYRELERQVIQTEQNLGKLEKQSDETREALGKAGDDAENTGKDFQDAGDKSKSFQDKMQTLASVTIVIEKVAGAVKKVADNIMNLATQGATYADNVLTMSTKLGVAVEDLQKFQYYSELVDVSVEDFAGSLTKLTTNIGKAERGSKNQKEAFEKLGVSIKDSNGNLRDAEDIYYDVIDALGEIENDTEASITANDLFGKSYANLKPLIEKGSGALKELGQEAEDAGYVLSDDMVGALGDLDDAIQRNKKITEGLGNYFSAGFAKSMTDAQNKINKTLASKQTQDSLKNLGEIVGNIVSFLSDIAGFVLEHADSILAFVSGVVGAVIAVNWSKIAGGITKCVDALKSLASTPAGQIALIAGAVAMFTTEILKVDDEFKDFIDNNNEVISSSKDLREEFNNNITSLQDTATEANNLVGEIDALNGSIVTMRKEGKDTTEQEDLLKQKVRELNDAMGTNVAHIDASTGLLLENTNAIKDNVKQLQLQAEAQAYQDYYIELKKRQIELETQQKQFIDKSNEALDKQNEIGWKSIFASGATTLTNNLRNIGDSYNNITTELTNVGDEIAIVEGKLQGLPEVHQEVADSVTLISDAEAYRLIALKETNGELTVEQEAYLATYQEYNAEQYASLEDLVKKEQELQATRLSLMQQSDNLINTQSDISLKQRAKNIRDNTQAIMKYESNMAKIRQTALTTTDKTRRDALTRMINELSDYSERSIGIVNDLATDFAESGGNNAWAYVDAYSASMNTGAGKLNSTTATVAGGAITAGGNAIANNPAMSTQASRAIDNTEIALKSQVRYSDFASIGTSITNEIAKGISSGSRYLFDKAEQIAKGLKSRLNINVLVTSGSTGTKIRGYATGGIAWTPQLATVAEREPEAIIPLSKLGNIVGSARGRSTPNINVTLNAQKVTDAEAHRLVQVVSKEFARRTGNRI